MFYETTSEVKAAICQVRPLFAKGTYFSNPKPDVNESDLDKSQTVPNDLKKLNDVIEFGVFNKKLYDKVHLKVTDIDVKVSNANKLVSKSQWNAYKQNLVKEPV